jgi:hypothetical protein
LCARGYDQTCRRGTYNDAVNNLTHGKEQHPLLQHDHGLDDDLGGDDVCTGLGLNG